MSVPLVHGELPLVGRERELATLTAMLAEAARGHGAVALVAGEPGIGKTRLVEELVAQAAEQGARPLWGRCYEGEGVPAFWPWLQILRGELRELARGAAPAALPASAADLLPLLPELATLLPAGTPPAEPDPDPASARFRLFAAAGELLTAAAGRGPLLLLLDDLHWADVPTLSLLQFLAAELAGVPLLVVGTYRDVEVGRDHPFAPVLTRLRRTRGFRQLALDGLSPEAVAELLAALGAAGASADYAQALCRHTDGNPFFLGETVRHLADSGLLGEVQQGSDPAIGLSAIVPDAVRDVILNRCGRLSLAAQALLNAASVVGIEFGLGTLSGVTELQQLPLLDVLDEIVAAGLIAAAPGVPPRFRFAHALVREALYEEIGAGAKVRLHQQVGTAIEAVHGADVEPALAELAWHFAQAAPAGAADVQKALDYCGRAAQRSARVHAYEDAAAQYELALRVLPLQAPVDEERRCELLMSLADVQARAGDFARANAGFIRVAEIARALRERLGSFVTGNLMARAAVGYGGQWLPNNQIDLRHIALLEEALAALDAGAHALRAALLSRLAEALRDADLPERRRAVSAEALAAARRSDDPLALQRALATRWATLMDFQVRGERLAVAAEARGLAQRYGDPSLALAIRTVADDLEIGDVAGVERELERLDALAHELRQPYAQWRTATLRAMLATLAGRFAAADTLAQEAHALGRRMAGNPAGDVLATQHFFIAMEQGRFAELEPLIAQAIARQPDVGYLRFLHAFLRSRQGDLDAAREAWVWLQAEEFATIRRGDAWVVHLSMLTQMLVAAATASTAAASDARASDAAALRTVYALLAPYAGSVLIDAAAVVCRGAADQYLGLLALALACAPAAVADQALLYRAAHDHFQRALRLHERMGAAPFLARTRCAYAALLLEPAAALSLAAAGEGKPAVDARLLLEQAWAASRDLEIADLAQQVARLRIVAGSERGPNAAPGPLGALAPALPDGLSSREAEVLGLVAAGHSNRAIADQLVLSVVTVQNHIANIYRKTGLRSRAEAATYAVRNGLVPPQPAE